MDRNWRVLLIAGVISLCSAQFVFASYSLGDSGDAVKDLQRRLTPVSYTHLTLPTIA